MKSVVFFSGGTAMASTALEFAKRGLAPIFIITTFDSGGSTQAIRKIVDMPAIGDLRNRLLACAGADPANAAAVRFLKRRLAKDQTPQAARIELAQAQQHLLGEPFAGAALVLDDLRYFVDQIMTSAFDARGASLGNLALAGAWRRLGRSLGAALDRYRALLGVKAKILPVCGASLHLALKLADGSILKGQHRLREALDSQVADIFLTRAAPWSDEEPVEARVDASAEALEALAGADLICFPPGSFYSSILANLLPNGIGEAVARSNAVKVYVPNTGEDIEMAGLSIQRSVWKLAEALRRGCPGAPLSSFINLTLADLRHGNYGPGAGRGFGPAGPALVDLPIVGSDGRHSAAALVDALERLA